MSDKKTNMKQLFCSFVKRDVYFAVSKNPILPQFPTKYIENIYLSLSEKWYIHPGRVFVSTGWDNEVLISFLGEKKLRRKTTLKGDIMRARYCIQCTWVMLFFSDIQKIFFRQKRIYYIIYNYCTIDVYNCTFWMNYSILFIL